MPGSPIRKFILLAVFSIAMAYVESAVVVYLRMLFYPQGFHFPLVEMPVTTSIIELGRELATIVMLVVIGNLAGRNRLERFFYFIFCFGIWDIFYYVWLKIFLDWPASWLENDILFLIPVPWIGPVLAPIIVSVTMIIAAVLSLHYQGTGNNLKADKKHLLLVIIGCVIILISFFRNVSAVNLYEVSNPDYHWGIFFSGEVMLIAGLVLFLYKNYPGSKKFYVNR